MEKPSPSPLSTSKSTSMILMSSTPEPTIWTCDTGQQTTYFDSWQLIIMQASNINLKVNQSSEMACLGWPSGWWPGPCMLSDFIVVIVIHVHTCKYMPANHTANLWGPWRKKCMGSSSLYGSSSGCRSSAAKQLWMFNIQSQKIYV